MSKIISHSYEIQFDMNELFIKTLDGQYVIKGFRNGNFYFINYKKINKIEIVAFTNFLKNQDKFRILHQ